MCICAFTTSTRRWWPWLPLYATNTRRIALHSVYWLINKISKTHNMQCVPLPTSREKMRLFFGQVRRYDTKWTAVIVDDTLNIELSMRIQYFHLFSTLHIRLCRSGCTVTSQCSATSVMRFDLPFVDHTLRAECELKKRRMESVAEGRETWTD